MSSFLPLAGGGKFVGLGAGGAVSSYAAYRRADGAAKKEKAAKVPERDASRGRSAETNTLKEEADTRHDAKRNVHHEEGEQLYVSTEGSPKNATRDAPKTTGTTTAVSSGAPKQKAFSETETGDDAAADLISRERGIDEEVTDACEVTTLTVDMRGHNNEARRTHASPPVTPREKRRARTSSRGPIGAVPKNANKIATVALVAAPFALAAARGLFRLRGSSRDEHKTHKETPSNDHTTVLNKPNLDKVRAFVFELQKTEGGNGAASEISKLLKQRDALARSVKEQRLAKPFATRKAPFMSLRSKAAVASYTNREGQRDGSRNGFGETRSVVTEYDETIGFQAKELRFLRLALAEKDATIRGLTELRAARNGVRNGVDGVSLTKVPFTVSEQLVPVNTVLPKPESKWEKESDSDVLSVSSDASDQDCDAAVDLTLDETVDEVLAELKEERKRNSEVCYGDDGGSDENKENDVYRREQSRRKTFADRRMFDTPAKKYADPSERIEVGKSRVLRISPTRRQKETNHFNSLMRMR